MPGTPLRVLLLTLLAAAPTGGAIAVARGPHSSRTVIQACVRKDGRLRLVAANAACRRNEHPISWNVRGPQGERGPQGPKGDPGTIDALERLNGVACRAGGRNGAVTLTYDASAHAVFTCTAATTDATVRVNEFSTGTSASATDEFVELVNTGSSPADLSGYKLVYRSGAGTSDVSLATIPDGTTLAPAAFYLFGGSGYAGAKKADQSFSTALAATAGGIGLRDAGGKVVDSVGYGTATNAFVEMHAASAPPATAAPGSSDIRLPDGADTDDNGADFTVTAAPTPGAPNAAG